MNNQISAIQNVLSELMNYRQDLLRASSLVTSDHMPQALRDSLVSELQAGGEHVAAQLTKAAQDVEDLHKQIVGRLILPDVVDALTTIYGGLLGLDSSLEDSISLQSPSSASIPPPYRYFSAAEDRVRAAFPRKPQDNLATREVMQLQRYLEDQRNPWKG